MFSQNDFEEFVISNIISTYMNYDSFLVSKCVSNYIINKWKTIIDASLMGLRVTEEIKSYLCLYCEILELYKDYLIYINKRKVLKKNIRINIVIFSTSIIIWNIDNLYCNEINQKIQLHAIWHILTSIGMFYLNEMFTIYLELNMLLN